MGLIPSKRTWTGGYKAVGKTLETAQLVWRQCRALEEAGAFAVEIEVVPQQITAAIAERTGLFLISMGGGAGGPRAVPLHRGRAGPDRGATGRATPRSMPTSPTEHARLQEKRVAAMTAFADEVHSRRLSVARDGGGRRARGGGGVPRLARPAEG